MSEPGEALNLVDHLASKMVLSLHRDRGPREVSSRGFFIPSPSALALCSTLLLFPSFTLSLRYSSLFSCNKTKLGLVVARLSKGELFAIA